MSIFAIAVLVIFAIDLLFMAYLHGKPRDGKHSFWITLITTGVLVKLLWDGGFFK